QGGDEADAIGLVRVHRRRIDVEDDPPGVVAVQDELRAGITPVTASASCTTTARDHDREQPYGRGRTEPCCAWLHWSSSPTRPPHGTALGTTFTVYVNSLESKLSPLSLVPVSRMTTLMVNGFGGSRFGC